MKHFSKAFRVGTRPSNLAGIQAADALKRLSGCLPELEFELVRLASPGDGDRTTDLRESPADFFTRDLDRAVLAGHLDVAIHSAKDVPDPVPDGLDWFWLPWRADPRDVLVCREGESVGMLPARPVVGVSSDRRAAYVQQRFPSGEQCPVRGNIEERLQQLDEGAFDLLVMAGAALERLGLEHRATEWIALDALIPPQGQGVLAVTYRAGDRRIDRLRALFVPAVRFVGAGVGSVGHLTLAGQHAIERADDCFYDRLMDPEVLRFAAPDARCIDVGKRWGQSGRSQEATTGAMLDAVRRGRRVVRVKGGDPGLFGRLVEELDALNQREIPYQVIPGISSLAVATTGTGLLLTRREVSSGFTVLTPRGAGGASQPMDAASRASMPVVCFMAVRAADRVVAQLTGDGWPADTPAAIVLEAGGERERIIETTLAAMGTASQDAPRDAAGLLIVGEVCRHRTVMTGGGLQGLRVMLTCSAAIQDRAAAAVVDHGGIPVRTPLIRMTPCSAAVDALQKAASFDWMVLTSPHAVKAFLEVIRSERIDWRRLPRLMACGPGTARALREGGLPPELVPAHSFGAAGLIEAARGVVCSGERVLRLRSAKASPSVTQALKALGAEVTDCVLYDNKTVSHESRPSCGAVFFASASAVESFVDQAFPPLPQDTVVVTIGEPTAAVARRAGISVDVIARPATVEGAMASLACHEVAKAFGGGTL